MLALMILNFLLLPLTMLLTSFIFFTLLGFFLVSKINESCCKITMRKFERANFLIKILIILLVSVQSCVVLTFSAALAAVLTALVIVPAYIMQLYKIVKIILFWGCKSRDEEKA